MNARIVEAQYTSGVYAKRDRTIVRGKGTRVWDAEGRAYIDCVAGIGVASAGHCHPAITEAITQQAQMLLSCPELFYSDRRADLLQRLAALTPGSIDRFFLCNSGAEAVEGAIKFARLATGRSKIVAAMRGFHGRTLGALSATHNAAYRQPFEPLVPHFKHVPFDNIERAAAAIGPETAAVLVEIVQGEGGVRVGSVAYFQALRQLCDEHGALLIVDEVQTGFGRTGRLFACDHMAIVPDLLCMGKAIAGGVPMGAIGIGPRVRGLRPGIHSSTFGGNPLACAAALATLDVLEREGLPARAADLGAHFYQRLQAIDSPLIREVRGLGLMVGIELCIRARAVVEGLADLATSDRPGILALTAGTTVLRLLPPLIIEKGELEAVACAIEEVLAACER